MCVCVSNKKKLKTLSMKKPTKSFHLRPYTAVSQPYLFELTINITYVLNHNNLSHQ